jgi:hypothetical protein
MQVQASATTIAKLLTYLSEAGFIDSHTSHLSVQFVAYNNPTEAFTSATIALERGQQGTFEGTAHVELASAGWYNLHSGDGWLRLLCDGFLFSFGMYTVGRAFLALKHHHVLRRRVVRP